MKFSMCVCHLSFDLYLNSLRGRAVVLTGTHVVRVRERDTHLVVTVEGY